MGGGGGGGETEDGTIYIYIINIYIWVEYTIYPCVSVYMSFRIREGEKIPQHQPSRWLGHGCAGAHWLSCRDLPLWGHALPLVPHDNQNWRRGIGCSFLPCDGRFVPPLGAFCLL